MNAYPDACARAAEFQKRASLTQSFRRPLPDGQATILATQCEALFQHISNAGPQGATPGLLRMRYRDGELVVRYSGNSREGRLILSRGESFYTQVKFDERSITIYQSEQASFGFLRTDTAAVLDRTRPRASVSFGRTPSLSSLLKASA